MATEVVLNEVLQPELALPATGDFVPLVWLIDSLRRREGSASMNETISVCNKYFNIKDIKLKIEKDLVWELLMTETDFHKKNVNSLNTF